MEQGRQGSGHPTSVTEREELMRYFSLGRKAAHVTLAECHAHLAQRHGPLVSECHGFRAHCRHYTQNHILGSANAGTGELRQQDDPPFHYCSEFWYEDVDALVRGYQHTDYATKLRPDTQLFADGQARCAFMAEQVWETGQSVPPMQDRATKFLVLHLEQGTQVFDGSRAPQSYPGFFQHCLRAAYHVVTGQLDMPSVRPRAPAKLPFHAFSELWFANAGEASAALASNDGKRLLAHGRWLPSRPEQATILWATERIIF